MVKISKKKTWRERESRAKHYNYALVLALKTVGKFNTRLKIEGVVRNMGPKKERVRCSLKTV